MLRQLPYVTPLFLLSEIFGVKDDSRWLNCLVVCAEHLALPAYCGHLCNVFAVRDATFSLVCRTCGEEHCFRVLGVCSHIGDI